FSHSLSASGNTVYYAWGNVYVTSNGGASWTPLAVSASDIAYQVAASPQNASILYVLTGANTVRKSTDGGSTWASPGTGLDGLTYNTSSLIVDPFDSSHALVVSRVNQSGFVVKLNSAGSALSWSTYLGGAVTTFAYAVAADEAGHAFVTGSAGLGFPVTSTALPSGNLASPFITEISDATAACSVTVTPAGPTTISPYAQTLTFTVVAPSGCPWSSGSSQEGTGIFTLNVPYNSSGTTQQRTVTVGDQSVTVTQAASSCGFSLDQSSYSVPASDGPVSAVLTAGSGCPWAVTNNYASAISFTTASSGTGSGTIGL